MWTKLMKDVLDKVLSGRFLLTMACAIVFVWASLHKILEAQAVSAIIASVFQAYFSRNDRQPPSTGATV